MLCNTSKLQPFKLCASFEIKYSLETSWSQIIERIEKPIASGIEVIEIPTDRKKDHNTRQKLLSFHLLPMPELAEVAFACGKWNPGIGKF